MVWPSLVDNSTNWTNLASSSTTVITYLSPQCACRCSTRLKDTLLNGCIASGVAARGASPQNNLTSLTRRTALSILSAKLLWIRKRIKIFQSLKSAKQNFMTCSTAVMQDLHSDTSFTSWQTEDCVLGKVLHPWDYTHLKTHESLHVGSCNCMVLNCSGSTADRLISATALDNISDTWRAAPGLYTNLQS